MKWIYDLPYNRLSDELINAGLKKYSADQVFQWLYLKNVQDISLWSNISKVNRQKLGQVFDTHLCPVETVKEDKEGTQKVLLQLHDGQNIEAVSIKEKDHYTFCLSTQVGCALGCTFCATGKLGFTRNLSSGEILSQILQLKKRIPDYNGKINLVFMGMGEPMLNDGNVKQALEIITAEKGIGISPRNITVSTAGIFEPLRRFEQEFPRVKISFSLNGPSAKKREELMPISRKESLDSFLDYFRYTKRKYRVTFEYVMLKGINDSLEDARSLSKLLWGISCKINLIPYNESSGSPYSPPSKESVEKFSDFLHQKNYTVMVRWSKGRDIDSACGQLAAKALNRKESNTGDRAANAAVAKETIINGRIEK